MKQNLKECLQPTGYDVLIPPEAFYLLLADLHKPITEERQINLDSMFLYLYVKYASLMMGLPQSLNQDPYSQEEDTWEGRFFLRLFDKPSLTIKGNIFPRSKNTNFLKGKAPSELRFVT